MFYPPKHARLDDVIHDCALAVSAEGASRPSSFQKDDPHTRLHGFKTLHELNSVSGYFSLSGCYMLPLWAMAGDEAAPSHLVPRPEVRPNDSKLALIDPGLGIDASEVSPKRMRQRQEQQWASEDQEAETREPEWWDNREQNFTETDSTLASVNEPPVYQLSSQPNSRAASREGCGAS